MNIGLIDGSPKSYRGKIKGYHKPFPVKEPLNLDDMDLQHKTPKYLNKLTSDEL